MTRVDVEQNARLMRERALETSIDVQRALGVQVATAAVQTIHIVKIRKLTIDAAATAQARVVANPQLCVDPRGRRRFTDQRPMVDTSTRRDRQPRAQADSNLSVR